ncbi:MAG: PDDEXK nuclease domain-containing protein [Thermodesulfobacteriota bacterium]
MTDKHRSFDFGELVTTIREVDKHLAAQAGRAVNVILSLRNWLIGYYIREYEQRGADRAQYGERLLVMLSERLSESGMEGMSPRSLRLYRQFYLTYPRIWQTVSAESFPSILPEAIWQSLSTKSRTETSTRIARTSFPKSHTPDRCLANSLSFSHFAELITIDDPSKRTFYEIECLQSNWSVRELKRQIVSLYYERSGLSRNKKKLAEIVRSGAQRAESRLEVRDPYVFEFLGIKSREVMGESDLEDALLDKLQDFLLELGHGFCFEARQKRILIGDTYGFVDLVFYHRILKCHVLVELKVDEFRQEYLGQINTYVSWYQKNMMSEGDHSPVGILLCTRKDHVLVEYALASLDNKLFVSRYQLELPDKARLQAFLEDQLREVN